MKSIYITHRCGHVKQHTLYDDDDRAEWLARQMCVDCYRREKTITGKALAEQLGLPKFENGNARGIEWAEGIRGTFIKAVWKWAAELIEKNEMTAAQGDRIKTAILIKAAERGDFEWWIRNRENLKKCRAMWGLFFLDPETRKGLARIHQQERRELKNGFARNG